MRKWVNRTLDWFVELMLKRGYASDFVTNFNLVKTSNSLSPSDYPWYQAINGNDLAQGDILLEFPVFDVPENYLDCIDTEDTQITINYCNLIIMTQSCDLAIRQNGRSKIDYVLLCPIYFKKELQNDKIYGKLKEWENARQGKHLGFHVLNCCNLKDHNYDFMLVDLKRTHSIKFEILRDFVSKKESRVRLLPPYREHLSQAFARFFMRVGLPVDIPNFSK